MNTYEWLESLTFNDGFDRNGSHDAGEYREYEHALRYYLADWIMHQLAEHIDDRCNDMEVK